MPMDKVSNEWTDEELAHAYVDGNSEALNLLVERHWGAIRKHALHYCRDHEEAEDITTEVVIKLYTTKHFFDNRGIDRQNAKFLGWLGTLIRNTAISHMRKYPRRDISELNMSELEWNTDEDGGLESVPDPSVNPDAEIITRFEMGAILEAVNSLQHPYGRVIQLKMRDFTLHQIGAMMDLELLGDTSAEAEIKGKKGRELEDYIIMRCKKASKGREYPPVKVINLYASAQRKLSKHLAKLGIDLPYSREKKVA